eukprot:20079-Heterococcus_DN1.PRE.1
MQLTLGRASARLIPLITHQRSRAGFPLTALSTHAAQSASTITPPLLSDHPNNNVPASVAAKVGRNLHKQPDHPLNIIKTRIEDFFKETPVLHNKPQFEVYDSLPPVVKITDNFDSLLIPPEHVSRKATDTYYVDDVHVLRTHTR